MAKELTLEELKEALAARETENKTLSAKLEATEKTVTGLQSDIKTHVSEKGKLQTDLTQASGIIAEQHERLTKAESAPELGVIITVDKKKYRVVAPKFIHAGKTVTAAELKEDKELQAKLVATNSAILEAVS